MDHFSESEEERLSQISSIELCDISFDSDEMQSMTTEFLDDIEETKSCTRAFKQSIRERTQLNASKCLWPLEEQKHSLLPASETNVHGTGIILGKGEELGISEIHQGNENFMEMVEENIPSAAVTLNGNTTGAIFSESDSTSKLNTSLQGGMTPSSCTRTGKHLLGQYNTPESASKQEQSIARNTAASSCNTLSQTPKDKLPLAEYTFFSNVRTPQDDKKTLDCSNQETFSTPRPQFLNNEHKNRLSSSAPKRLSIFCKNTANKRHLHGKKNAKLSSNIVPHKATNFALRRSISEPNCQKLKEQEDIVAKSKEYTNNYKYQVKSQNQAPISTTLVRKVQQDDNSCYYQLMEADPDLCATKIFCRTMLAAWRTRRKELNSLRQKAEKLQQQAPKYEQKQTFWKEALQAEEAQHNELKQLLEATQHQKQEAEHKMKELAKKLQDLSLTKEQCQQEYHEKQEFVTTTKAKIKQKLAEQQQQLTPQQKLRSSLAHKQAQWQLLNNERAELELKIEATSQNLRESKESHLQKLEQKQQELEVTSQVITKLERYIKEIIKQDIGVQLQRAQDISQLDELQKPEIKHEDFEKAQQNLELVPVKINSSPQLRSANLLSFERALWLITRYVLHGLLKC